MGLVVYKNVKYISYLSSIINTKSFDNLGFIAGFGKGFLRVLKINANLIGDVVPVDIPVNLMIAAAWNRAMEETYYKACLP